VRALLRANTAEAMRLGIFGAPDFVVSGELFFGQDRLRSAGRCQQRLRRETCAREGAFLRS
jgi:2-hydroxychromene-2-carboxylate isomerase